MERNNERENQEDKDDDKIKKILTFSKNNEGRNSTFLTLDSDGLRLSDLKRLDVFKKLTNIF
jgi:hypothetical protein